MKKIFLAGLIVASVITIESCGPSSLTISARPERPYYARPIAPGPDYVWIEGDWRIRNGRYYWSNGHWARSGRRIWIEGSWEPRNNGWYWRRGHWNRR